MQRRLLPLTALRAFEAVVRCGGVSAAATDLGVTHGAISKQLAQLQARCRYQLLHRTAAGLRPTAEAAALAARLAEGFDLLADAYRGAEAAPATEGLLVLAPASFALQWLVPRLRGFWEPRGEPPTRVQTTHSSDDWRAFAFDLAIRRNFQPLPGFAAEVFLAERNTLIAAPDVAERLARRGLAQLLEETVLSSDSRPGELEQWLQAAGLSRHPRQQQRFGHFYLMLQAVLTGQGLAVGPLPMLQDLVDSGRLVLPFPDVTLPVASYALVIPSNRRRRPRDEAFRDWLFAEAAAGGEAPLRTEAGAPASLHGHP